MSLHAIADHMASKGRGPDSMLIHMAPSEVRGLQALAVQHGGSLTINPETGLPEAGFLDKLLPAIIGFAITATTGIPAWQVGLGVGAFETARTGDFGKGISAGLGAYGGSGLGEGLAATGAAEMGKSTIADALAAQEATIAGTYDAGSGIMSSEALQKNVADKLASASPFEKIAAGAGQATSSPSAMGDFAGNNWKSGLSAISPVLADQAVKSNMPTTTTRPGEMRRFSYDPYGQIYTPTGNYEVPVKAAGGGLMGMNDGGYNPGELNFMQRSEPVVRMADGGTPPTYNSVEDLYTNILGRAPDTEGLAFWKQGFGDTIDPNEVASFKTAAQAELAKRTAPEQQILAPNLVNTTGTAAPATTVNDLYTSILGRTGEQSGLEHWQKQFGDTIDANELAQFKTAAQAEIDARPKTVAASTATDTSTTGGLSNLAVANNITDVTGGGNNVVTGGGGNNVVTNAATTGTTGTTGAVTSLADAKNLVANMYRNVLGRDADPIGLDFWSKAIASGRSAESVYQDFLASARSNTELVTADQIKNKTFADATKAYTGYMSADATNIVDDWVRNTLGREPTDADRQQKWYKDAYTSMSTQGQAKGLYDQFLGYAGAEAKTEIANRKAAILAELRAKGLTEADLVKQTTKTIDQLATEGIDLSRNLIGASQLAPAGGRTAFDLQAALKKLTPITNTSDGSVVSRTVTNPYGNATNPGDITRNVDGSTTVTPNIPYRPYGGFSGMGEVRNAYTQGGGSLGYTSPTYTKAQFKEQYEDKLTGGSKEAYDRLTGKTKYSPVPYTETGEVMKPYVESVLGRPLPVSTKRVLFDPATKTYKNNPDYIPVSYTDKGKKVYGLSGRDIATQLPAMDAATSNYEKWMEDNNVTLAQIAEALNISLAEAKKRYGKKTEKVATEAKGGLLAMAGGGMAEQFNLGGYSDGGRLLRGPGDGVSDSIPATIGNKRPARLADGEFVVPARIVSELGNGSTEAGARKLYAMMDRVQAARRGSIGKGKVAKNSRADKHLPA